MASNRKKVPLREIPDMSDLSDISSSEEEYLPSESESSTDSETDLHDADELYTDSVHLQADGSKPSTSTSISSSTTSSKKGWSWRKTGETESPLSTPDWISSAGCSREEKSPVAYFREYISDQFIRLVVKNTNLYSCQKNISAPLQLNALELEQFLGITLYMSIFKLPSSRTYWEKSCCVSQVADVMSRQRWEDIKAISTSLTMRRSVILGNLDMID
ncbi:Uncharacterised protein r2_g1335 [Pycnogonum litorale]